MRGGGWLAALAMLGACAHAPITASRDPSATGTSTSTPTSAATSTATPTSTPTSTSTSTPTPTPTPTATSTPTPTPTPTAGIPDVTLALVGDLMLGSTFPDAAGLPPDDARSLLAEAAPVLRAADLAIGNLEGPMLEGGWSAKCARSKPGHCYAFRMPTRYAALLRQAGIGAVSLANNHAGDFGPEGRASTRRALDQAGIAHAGEPGDVARLTVKGRRLALVAFATSEATMDLRDVPGARALVAGLAREADLVVVSFHGGAEGAAHQRVPEGPESFYGESRGDLRAFARAMVEAGAALVFGHGPHVARGMEVHRGRLIAYSLGNFATYGAFNLAGPNALAPLLTVTLGPDGAFRGGRVEAFRQEKPGGPRRDPAGEVVRRIAELSRQDFGPSGVRLTEDGLLLPPEPPPGAQRSTGSAMPPAGSP